MEYANRLTLSDDITESIFYIFQTISQHRYPTLCRHVRCYEKRQITGETNVGCGLAAVDGNTITAYRSLGDAFVIIKKG
eukprot:scaffold2091_cov146-Skeletonema_dohrnii-CCMP3373.AAC.1